MVKGLQDSIGEGNASCGVGGFHSLKSFLGCIGYIMADSGLEKLVQIVFPGDVSNIMDGSSYYKSLRAHFLIDAALCLFFDGGKGVRR